MIDYDEMESYNKAIKDERIWTVVNEIGGKYMLTEERFTRILSILESMGSVTVQQLMTELDASESTIRRDLNTLDANGQLIKVMVVRF